MFYVWVNALSAVYAENIVGRLVRRNWQCAALGNQLVLHNEDAPGSLIAFSISRGVKEGEPELTYSHAYDEVRDVLKVLGIKYYSIIVTEPCASTWSLGNLSITEAAKQDEAQRRGLN